MIPLPQIIAELVMALGGGLLVGNVWALVGPKIRGGSFPSARGRIMLNIFIGAFVFIEGLASFITKSSRT